MFCTLFLAKPQPERTLILLKPETVQRKLVGKIIERFEDAGLKLVALKFIQVCSICFFYRKTIQFID
ncbi:MAG: hypothetical protein EOP45_23115 [Sphingobacteriaceae bacterium]|nr:MAG: hypothetical protein EOP45_23115 [Sphingobacteriaceae bacterium]